MLKNQKLNKSYFITFEGGDGSGKTTLIDKVLENLSLRGFKVIKTREPGGTKLSEEVRTLVLKNTDYEVSPYAELCLYLAARAQHIKEVIRPSLDQGKIVLCDRFNDSTIAYQGYGRNLDVDKVESFCAFVTENLKPDLTFYLNIDPKVAIKRAKKPIDNLQKGYDRIENEKISFHEKIREAFLTLSEKEPDRFIIIDASKTKEEVLKTALEALEKRLFS